MFKGMIRAYPCKSVCSGRTSKNPLKNFRQKHHPATALAVWNPRFSKVLWPSWHTPCEHMPRGQVRSRQKEKHVKLIAKKNEGLGVFLWYFCDTSYLGIVGRPQLLQMPRWYLSILQVES